MAAACWPTTIDWLAFGSKARSTLSQPAEKMSPLAESHWTERTGASCSYAVAGAMPCAVSVQTETFLLQEPEARTGVLAYVPNDREETVSCGTWGTGRSATVAMLDLKLGLFGSDKRRGEEGGERDARRLDRVAGDAKQRSTDIRI